LAGSCIFLTLIAKSKLVYMKRLTFTVCATMLLFVASSQPMDSATMMKNWQTYMTPGEPHKMLAKSNGTWNSEVTMWQAPGGPAQTSKGTMVNKMVMGGRYQVSNFTGNMMGMPFEGMSTVAYDNHKKVFITTWIDNMGTGLMTAEGPWDDATKCIHLKGKMVDPSTGMDVDFREEFKIVDDNTQNMEMYVPAPDGKEFKTMEIKYTRKK
jgi:Protein of unknown function (DUF1579)